MAKVFDWLQAYLDGKLGYTFGDHGEKGIDIGVPVGSPIGSISSGKVIYAGLPPDSQVNGHRSLGYVVQIQAPNGELWHYQHLSSLRPGLQAGQNVGLGDVIAYSGGCATYKSDGSGCATTDAWSSGPHIEVRNAKSYNPNGGIWSQGWIDPRTRLSELALKIVNNPAWDVTAQQSLNQIPTMPAPCNDTVAQLQKHIVAVQQSLANRQPIDVPGIISDQFDLLGSRLNLNFQYFLCQFEQGLIKGALFIFGTLLVIFGLHGLAKANIEQSTQTGLGHTIKKGIIEA